MVKVLVFVAAAVMALASPAMAQWHHGSGPGWHSAPMAPAGPGWHGPASPGWRGGPGWHERNGFPAWRGDCYRQFPPIIGPWVWVC